MNKSAALIIFTKTPVLGMVKTRMLPLLTEFECLKLHIVLLRHAIERVKSFDYPSLERNIFITPFEEPAAREIAKWIGRTRFSIHSQKGSDLGERLSNAMDLKFKQGFEKVVIIGIDSPLIGGDEFRMAFELLQCHEAVLGPANDGGYYLLGLTSPKPFLFRGIDWGTEIVFHQTVASLRMHSVPWGELPLAFDLDTFQDLQKFLDQAGGYQSPKAAETFDELRKYIRHLVGKAK
jgi:rSAM/selenodomain-associated transferase 1